jgi:hypothetical protein
MILAAGCAGNPAPAPRPAPPPALPPVRACKAAEGDAKPSMDAVRSAVAQSKDSVCVNAAELAALMSQCLDTLRVPLIAMEVEAKGFTACDLSIEAMGSYLQVVVFVGEENRFAAVRHTFEIAGKDATLLWSGWNGTAPLCHGNEGQPTQRWKALYPTLSDEAKAFLCR